MALATGELAQICESLKSAHWNADRRILRTINGTWDLEFFLFLDRLVKIFLVTLTGLVIEETESQQVDCIHDLWRSN